MGLEHISFIIEYRLRVSTTIFFLDQFFNEFLYLLFSNSFFYHFILLNTGDEALKFYHVSLSRLFCNIMNFHNLDMVSVFFARSCGVRNKCSLLRPNLLLDWGNTLLVLIHLYTAQHASLTCWHNSILIYVWILLHNLLDLVLGFWLPPSQIKSWHGICVVVPGSHSRDASDRFLGLHLVCLLVIFKLFSLFFFSL